MKDICPLEWTSAHSLLVWSGLIWNISEIVGGWLNENRTQLVCLISFCLYYKNWSVAVWSLIGRLPVMLKSLYSRSGAIAHVSIGAATAHLDQYWPVCYPSGGVTMWWGSRCIVVVVGDGVQSV